MGEQKKKLFDRILAIALSMLLVISMMPTHLLVAYAVDEPQSLTFIVKDAGGNALEDAKITLKASQEAMLPGLEDYLLEYSCEATTDADGKAEFEEYTDLGIAGQIYDKDIEYTVEKEGYVTETGSKTLTSYSDVVEIALELPSIPEGDYQITGFHGPYDGEEHSVVVIAPGYDVSYSVDGGAYSETVPSIKEVGDVVVSVKLEKEGYKDRIVEVPLKVEQANRTDFEFADKTPTDLVFATSVEELNADPGYVNLAASEKEPQAVTYESGDESIATVESDGRVTFKKQGTVIITATMPESRNYRESEASYTITTKMKRDSFAFTTTEPSALTYEKNLTYQNAATAQPVDGDIEYTIIEQIRDGEIINPILPDAEPVAEIDDEGTVTVLTAGKIKVQAVIQHSVYETKYATYDLTINKAPQNEFVFTQGIADLVYGEDFTFVAEGGAGTGAVTYEITAGTDFAEVDSDTGLVEAIKADGAVTITATKAADNCYAEATANTTFITSKAEQPAFKFVDATPDTVDYGMTSLVVKAEGGQAGGIITYSIEENSEIASIDSATGEITFKDGAEGTFTVKAVKSGVDNYLDIETTHDITVEANNYSAEYEISAPDGNDGWYKKDIKIRPKEGYLISTSNVIHETEGQWKTELVLSTDDKYENYTFYLKKIADNTIGKPIVIPELKLDNTEPSVTITYSQEKTLIEILKDVFDRFFGDTMTVTLDLEDNTSGISHIEYKLNNSDSVKTISNITDNPGKATTSFEIKPMYRGKIDITIFDVAGNSTVVDLVKKTGTNEIIVDNEKPVISVSYDNNNAVNDRYYKAERTATIHITETNFYADDVEVTMFKRSDDESETETKITPAFTKVEGTDNTYEMKIPFTDDADYHLKVEYEDKSGNEAVPYESGEFTVDKTKPVISYSGMEEGVYYSTDKELTLTIDEHNFDPAFVDFDIAATDKEGKAVDLSAKGYETYLQKADSWTKDENKYTAKILIDAEGTYSITTNYTDLAGNAAEGKSLGFIMDKTNPTVAVSYDNNGVANDTKFKAERKATITIDEHNFDASRVDVTVTAKDKYEKDIAVPNYAEHVKKAENWTTSGNVHSIVLTFDVEADYTFDVSCTDLSGRTDDGVVYAEGTKAAEAFTVDKTAPTGSIQIGKWDEKWTDFPTADADGRVFGRWSMDTVKVTVSSADELSDVDYVEHFRADKIMSLDEVKASTSWQKATLDQNGAFAYDVAPDERFVVYVRIVDKAGNVHYISSNGVIVDKTNPTVTNLAPEVTVTPTEQPVNGIYSTDVLVDVSVVDPLTTNDVMSGLKTVTYKVYNNAKPEGERVTQEGTLYSFENAAPQKDDLVHKYDKVAAITVDKTKNNSNDVIIEVTAVDNAGNTTTETCKVKIDITKPAIDVSYNNNDADSSKYFKKSRTATIVVTERNFDAEDVVVTITNTDGVIPKVGKWTKAAGTGNLDDTTWTSTITYKADGDYTFAIAYTDEAGNASTKVKYGDSVAPTKFTVDKVKPKVSVSYDNNNAKNGKYFAAGRTATVVITEHNLKPNGVDKDRVVISIDATDNGVKIKRPVVSSWKTEGDKHTATIQYAADGRYVFDVAIKDKAGNDSADFKAQEFYVDKTEPSLELTGVQKNSANSGKVVPVVTYTDTNYDAEQVEIKLTGANRGNVPLNGAYNDVRNGRAFVFQNFAEEKEVDDIYTLTAKVTDKAGNSKEETMSFSVNRFGSTYQMAAATEKIEGKYIQEPVDVTITEVNVNQLSNIVVTLFKNNEAKTLREGTDYSIGVSGGGGQWYRYTYTIFAKNFADDGVYSITVESNDAAGNSAKNDLDTKNAPLTFGVDSTEPIIIVENLESKQRIEATEWTVNMSIKDNLKLAKVIVELNGEQTVYEGKALAEIVKAGGNFTHTIARLDEAQTLKVYAIDAAGNGELVSETEVPANAAVIDRFYVTDNAWVLFYTNPLLLYGTIGGIILVGGLIVYLVVRKRKNGEEKSN